MSSCLLIYRNTRTIPQSLSSATWNPTQSRKCLRILSVMRYVGNDLASASVSFSLVFQCRHAIRMDRHFWSPISDFSPTDCYAHVTSSVTCQYIFQHLQLPNNLGQQHYTTTRTIARCRLRYHLTFWLSADRAVETIFTTQSSRVRSNLPRWITYFKVVHVPDSLGPHTESY